MSRVVDSRGVAELLGDLIAARDGLIAAIGRLPCTAQEIERLEVGAYDELRGAVTLPSLRVLDCLTRLEWLAKNQIATPSKWGAS